MNYNKSELMELLEYECASSWIAGFVTWGWLQDKIANHYVRRVKRKIQNVEKFRYLRSLRQNGATSGHILWQVMRLNRNERND